jgi:putative Mg2+ transporter-C (MgtC) family protein
MTMPLSPTWTDIAIRLALTMLAGAIIGLDRGVKGQAAGFRTTILVCLAASVAMIQTNVLLPLSGKTSDSFAVMDLMRLPLGILTGVGFIGGGTILKKGDLVTGVTTAATLWVVTVIGLCIGGGQIILGLAATGLTVLTLWILRWVDFVIPREHRAKLVVAADHPADVVRELPRLADARKFRARFIGQKQTEKTASTEYSFEISWRQPEMATPPEDLMALLKSRYDVKSFEVTADNA